RGRRYTDTVGDALARPKSSLVLQPVGSRTISIVNCGTTACPNTGCGGQGRGMRIRPWLSRREWEAGSPWGKFGQLEPSMAVNRGSRPRVASHRARAVAADKLIP